MRLTNVRVAVRILRVRQSTRASLCELMDLKAAENEQQAEQLVTEGLHFSCVKSPLLSVYFTNRKVMSPNSYSKSVPSWAVVCFSGYVQLYSPVRVLPVTESQSSSHKLHIVRETLERHPPRQISRHNSQSRLEPSMMSAKNNRCMTYWNWLDNELTLQYYFSPLHICQPWNIPVWVKTAGNC